MHILYLEDEPNDAHLVERYVWSLSGNTTISIAQDVPSAEAILAEQPSLLLVDIVLGNSRAGLDFVRSMRKRGYSHQIIAITALNLPKDVEQCFESGCTEVITKPFNIGELDRVLSRYIKP